MADKRRRARWPLYLSGMMLACVVWLYGFHPGPLAGAYIWPMTLWVVPGLLIGASARGVRHLPRAGVLVAWLFVWFALDDQPKALLPWWVAEEGPVTKVVSANCAGGDLRVVREALAEDPSLVLLQESPSRAEIVRLLDELGPEWNAVVGPDAAILAKGALVPVALPPGTGDFVAARWNGTVVVSLRLIPPVFRLDYYSPACWNKYRENREIRQAQLAEIVAWVRAHRGKGDLIVGGDFNTPPDPWVQESLRAIATDAFEAGRGWGGTAINEAPFVRIDQVWLAGRWNAVSTRAKKTRYSDHRMVVVELDVPT